MKKPNTKLKSEYKFAIAGLILPLLLYVPALIDLLIALNPIPFYIPSLPLDIRKVLPEGIQIPIFFIESGAVYYLIGLGTSAARKNPRYYILLLIYGVVHILAAKELIFGW